MGCQQAEDYPNVSDLTFPPLLAVIFHVYFQ